MITPDPAANPKPNPRGLLYYLKKMILYFVIAYLVVLAGVFFVQKKLIYFPAVESNLDPAQFPWFDCAAESIETKSADGTVIRGWHISQAVPSSNRPAPLSSAKLVVIFFCGNGGNRSDRVHKFRQYAPLGAHIVCFDYRGYGDSSGVPGENGIAQDARAAWDFVVAQGVSPKSIVIHGESLGGAVAVRLASELCSENTIPAGLIVEASFTKLADAATKHYPFIPAGLILTQRFPSIDRIPKVTCPLLMFHGPRDDVVPFALGKKLFDAAPAQAGGIAKQFVELPNCRHNDIGIADQKLYESSLRDFYARISK